MSSTNHFFFSFEEGNCLNLVVESTLFTSVYMNNMYVSLLAQKKLGKKSPFLTPTRTKKKRLTYGILSNDSVVKKIQLCICRKLAA